MIVNDMIDVHVGMFLHDVLDHSGRAAFRTEYFAAKRAVRHLQFAASMARRAADVAEDGPSPGCHFAPGASCEP